jgi:hypothetical protein
MQRVLVAAVLLAAVVAAGCSSRVFRSYHSSCELRHRYVIKETVTPCCDCP